MARNRDDMARRCACYNLRRASRAITRLYDGYFDEVGLKATQFTVLAGLASTDAPWTVTQLADALAIEQSSLSRNLAVLARLGYLRLVSGRDRRERIVALTRSGRAALNRATPIWRRAQAAVESVLDPRELEGQLRGLRRLTRAVQGLRHPGPDKTTGGRKTCAPRGNEGG